MARNASKPILLPVRGLDVSAPADFIDSSNASALQNMEINRNIIRKRYGTSAIGLSLNERTMRFAEFPTVDTSYLLRFGTSSVEQLEQGSNTWNDITGTALTASNLDYIDYAYPLLGAEKILTFTNNIDPIRKYTGSGTTTVLGGSPPLCKYMVAYGAYLILFYITEGGTVFPSRVQWCDTGNPEEWVLDNSGTADLVSDGQNIQAAALWSDYFTIHMENAIYIGYGVTTSDVFRFERKSTGIGTSAHMTVKELPTGGQIFLANDGVHIFDGNSAPLVQSRIVDEIREDMNPLYIRTSMGVVVRELDEYWLCVPIGDQTTPSTVYKYNYRTGDWFKDIRSNITAISTYTTTNDSSWDSTVGTWNEQTRRWDDVNRTSLNPVVIFGDSSGVSTARDNTVKSDNLVAIDGRYETKDFIAEDFGFQPKHLVRFKGFQLWAKGDFVDVAYSTDSGATWTKVGTLTLESEYPTDDEPQHAWFDFVSSQARFRLSNALANEVFTIKKFFIEADEREARR